MAEGDGPRGFRKKEPPAGEGDGGDEPPRLDLLDMSTPEQQEHKFHSNEPNEPPTPTRRENENPFSFKHFLQTDGKNYQSQGARPKQSRVMPELSSALPDFVQDHLVIEQCYLGNSQNNYNLDVNNLPDFTPNRNINNPGIVRRDANSTGNINIPLDLPVRPQVEFPLDLPINNEQVGSRSCPPAAEVGNSKSLPDFLADGAVRPQNNESHNSSQSPEREGDRLRQELDLVRRQLNEQIRRADYLSRELEVARNKEHEYTQNLAKALEQVEQNLERSNMRAASSESTILKLRQEVKSLTSEINMLNRENRALRGEEGAIGGPNYTISNELQTQRLAHELRQAANTAEHSLRQLLTGVDNLRILASSVESMSRIEEPLEPYPSSDCEDDAAGPAL